MTFDEVPGWFMPIDQAAFSWILTHQNLTEPEGALVELGVFKGKSAILIGNFRRPGEVFTACDLFEDIATSEVADPGERRFFLSQSLTQLAFERCYLAFHADLPRIVRGASEIVTRFVAPRTARFVHIDAGHTYDLVRRDLASARAMLRDTGVVAIADYRKPDTLGTAAAVWDAILNEGLKPILNTEFKLYATWGDPAPLQEVVRQGATEAGWCRVGDPVMIRGMPMLYLHRKPG